MPVLPSGKSITLVSQIRLLNAIQFAPESGKFWIDLPNDLPDFDPLPTLKIDNGTSRQVPVPQTKEEFTKFLTVVVSEEFGGPEIFKFNLCDFPPSGFLSTTDKTAWRNWLNSQPVQLFLEMRLAECFDQVEYFDRLKSLGLISGFDGTLSSDLSSAYDLFLEREPLEEKKLRHGRFLSRSAGYLTQLKSMRVKDPLVQVTWVDLLLEEFTILQAWKEGEEFFHNQYQTCPEQIEFHIAFLRCMYEQGKYEELEKALWEAVGQSPQKTEYWNLLIKKYLNQQAFAKAMEITNMALSINPENKELVENKFIIETTLRKLERK